LLQYLPPDSHSIADLGSGAGFPGLALAIASGIGTTLIESNAKKAAFLSEVIRKTGAPAQVINGRIEDVALNLNVSVVTARALAPLSKLLDLAHPLLHKGAQGLFLKGQDVEAELTESAKYWTMNYQTYPSTTDPHGVVLVVKEIKRA
jgi:16S rRNA (guanine527-N7)-methyltransferase